MPLIDNTDIYSCDKGKVKTVYDAFSPQMNRVSHVSATTIVAVVNKRCRNCRWSGYFW